MTDMLPEGRTAGGDVNPLYDDYRPPQYQQQRHYGGAPY
jgi:hypothetical protein